MKLKNSYFYTLRDDTKDEESISGNLLSRSGMIKKTSSGIYMFLPLGYKVIKNIEKIIREELESISCAELLMPVLINNDIYDNANKNSKKINDIFLLNDRFDKRYSLAYSHEQFFSLAAGLKIKSYKDLPFSIYQIQDKFRDEERSRYGLIRAREFLMKEAYSFDIDEKGLDNSYNEMLNAYKKIFTRLGIKYEIVKSDKSEMNGILSQEFQAIMNKGEDKLAFCKSCGYAANVNVAKCNIITKETDEDIKVRELIKTPNVGTIDDVSDFLNVSKKKIVKTLIYKIDGEFYAVLTRGDTEVNEAKLLKVLNANHISLATSLEVEEITGANIGFVGPIGLDIPIIIDNEISVMKNFIVGANKTDYHYLNVNLEDFNYLKICDIRKITENDVCPICGKNLEFKNGLEIGNIFKLGTKFSEDFNLTYLNKENENKYVQMGCYDIGLGRCMAAVVEQNSDDKGIVWPLEIAPFKVAIVVVNINDESQIDAANYLYNELKSNGISTILDDRDERVGIKFNDMDLIGIPYRITIGNKINEQMVEIKPRNREDFEEISLYDCLNKIEDLLDLY